MFRGTMKKIQWADRNVQNYERTRRMKDEK